MRIKNNYSQEELAAALDVTPLAIANWEIGDNTPNISQLKKISLLFCCTTDYLLFGTGNEGVSNDVERELCNVKERLDTAEDKIQEYATDEEAREGRIEKIFNRLLPIIPLCIFLFGNLVYRLILVAIFNAAWSDGNFPQGDGLFRISVFDWLNTAFFWAGVFACCVAGVIFLATNIIRKRKKGSKNEKES